MRTNRDKNIARYISIFWAISIPSGTLEINILKKRTIIFTQNRVNLIVKGLILISILEKVFVFILKMSRLRKEMNVITF